MSTKYGLLPVGDNTTKNTLPGPISQKSSSSSLKVKKYVYLLILFKMLVVIYIFSDEIFKQDRCDKGICEQIGPPTIIPNPEKFITYVPHSGLHNQRITLENAVYLAWVLNRTLILPPLILGKRFGYREYDKMHELVSSLKSDKTNLEQECANEMNPEECLEFHRSYMLSTWDNILNMTFIEDNVKIIYNHHANITKIIKNQLKIKDEENDVLYDKLYPGYHNFFEYSIPPEKIEPISDGRIKKYYILNEFRKQPQKLLVFGSLYGPGTIIRQSQTSIRFYHNVQESITPVNEDIKKVVKSIANRMGGTFNYLSAHGRAGDGTYMDLADQRIAYVINNLKRDMPDFDQLNMTLYQDLTESEKHELCFKNITIGPKLRKFSRLSRIYLASDVPSSSPVLQPIIQTFPCVYTMSDFKEELEPLRDIINPIDNQKMFKFIIPLVDLMAGSNARKVYTMGKSTFASYMLRYHHFLEHELGFKRLKR